MIIKQANLAFKGDLIPLNLNNIVYMVIHHPEAITATPEDIHAWHLANGWSGAGYNEYIRKDGTVYIIRGDNIGVQCANMNSKTYGICCEGNYDIETLMPEAQFQALVTRVIYHKSRFKNLKDVVPHKQLCNTACPGKYFPMQKLLNTLEVVNMNWKQILEKIASNPAEWENAITVAVNAANADGNLGALEIFKYLPALIEKIYNSK
jgi:hypothetical protein